MTRGPPCGAHSPSSLLRLCFTRAPRTGAIKPTKQTAYRATASQESLVLPHHNSVNDAASIMSSFFDRKYRSETEFAQQRQRLRHLYKEEKSGLDKTTSKNEYELLDSVLKKFPVDHGGTHRRDFTGAKDEYAKAQQKLEPGERLPSWDHIRRSLSHGENDKIYFTGEGKNAVPQLVTQDHELYPLIRDRFIEIKNNDPENKMKDEDVLKSAVTALGKERYLRNKTFDLLDKTKFASDQAPKSALATLGGNDQQSV